MSARKPDGGYILDLVRREGIATIGSPDGCNCLARIAIRNVVIDVHCQRSACNEHDHAGIHVVSYSSDGPSESELRAIADEVRRQLFADYPDAKAWAPTSLAERRY